MKIDGPLFAQAATGTIRGIGTFKTYRGQPYIAPNGAAPRTPPTAGDPIRTLFTEALAAYSAITPTWHKIGKNWHLYRLPRWPAFWAQYVIDNY